MQFSTLTEWLDWQQRLHSSSIDLGLERIRVVARRMSLLSMDCRIITVAGTNGKGSSVAMLEAMLQPHGRIGTYTSPHLLRYNERIRIDGMEVDDDTLCAAFEQVEQARRGTSLSFFEYGTLAAMWIFRERDIDIAVLEVGLGGRMDAVNLWDAEIALITSISLDHTEWLGQTREAIAREKAGIMRPGQIAICGEPDPPFSIQDHAQRLGTRLLRIGADYHAEPVDPEHWRYRDRDGMALELPIPHRMVGTVQLNNAASVLMILRHLEMFDPQHIRHALDKVNLVGRFQILDDPVDAILDIAHNPDSAVNLARNLRRHRPGRRLHAVFSSMREKDVTGMFEPLTPLFESWHLSEIESPRAMPLATLQLLAETCRLPNVHVHSSLADAWTAAARLAGADGTVVMFGSAFAVGEFFLARAQTTPDDSGMEETP